MITALVATLDYSRVSSAKFVADSRGFMTSFQEVGTPVLSRGHRQCDDEIRCGDEARLDPQHLRTQQV